jgi:hypothetical protein
MSLWKKVLLCGSNGKNRTLENLRILRKDGELSSLIGLD